MNNSSDISKIGVRISPDDSDDLLVENIEPVFYKNSTENIGYFYTTSLTLDGNSLEKIKSCYTFEFFYQVNEKIYRIFVTVSENMCIENVSEVTQLLH
jgi:hypothetical protein